jgi:hypothetical protein
MHREPAEQQLIDAEHLRLLRLGYFVAAAWNVFFVFFPLLYVAMGMAVFLLPDSSANDARWVGLVFAAIGGTISLLMAALTVMKFLTARALGQRRRRTLCLITAGISCLAFPYGTALGVATFVVLQRPTVIEQFSK